MANNLRVFQTTQEYNNADLVLPSVSYVVSENGVHYDVSSPEPPTPPQSNCYGVTYPSITAYSDTTYSSVYSFTDGKWYMLNNLNQYEEYGVYETGTSLSDFTTYEGKLVAIGTVEYQYSGGTWSVVGEYINTSITYEIDDSDRYKYQGVTLSTTFKIPVADVEALGWLDLTIRTQDNKTLYIRTNGYRLSGGGYEEGTVTSDSDYYYFSLPNTQEVVIDRIDWRNPTPIHLIVGSMEATVQYPEKSIPSSALTYSTVADMQAAKCPDVGVGQLCYTDGQVYRFDATEAWVTAQDSEILIKTWNASGDVSLLGTGYKGGEVAKGVTVTNATDIWIGSSVTYVNDLWSGLYDTLSACTITAVNPPRYSTNSSLPQHLTEIKVPCESVHTYRTSSNWRGINYKISSIEPSCQTIEYKARLYDANNNLLVELPRGTYSITSAETQSYKNSTYRIEFGDCFSYLYDGSFSGFSHISSVVIPSNVTNIDSSAFQGCSGLTSIDIPDSVTTIGSSAFTNCYGLTSIDIPDSVTTIGSSAFTNCYGLTSCTIGSGVTTIGYDAFANCSGLTSVTIPDSVTNIKSYTFVNCKSLTSVTIGSGVQGIGGYAFNGCSSLTSITILRERSVVNLWDISAFNNTNNCPIYVPANLVNSYKTEKNWKNLASRIKAIPT